MPNNLPEFIVKKVNEFQLNTDDLNGTLRGYQEFGSKYALMYKKTLLGDEMGLGKTVQALAVVGHLMKEGKKHSIVIAPLTLLSNWSREIKKWLGYDVYVFRTNKREEEYQSWKENGGVLLTNYEQTSQLLTSIENSESKIDLIVVDEAHKIKNPLAKRSINTYNITEKSEYALFMTGTALENRLQEMKQLISVLQPELIERIEKQAQDDDPIKFKKLVSLVYLRRKREEVLKELPDIEIIEQWSKFTEVQQVYYNEAVSKGISGMMSMRRAAFYEEENHQSEKIEQIISICEEAKDNGHKIIIFSFFKIVLKKILEYLKEETVGMISGDITTDERQKLIDDLTLAEAGSVLLAQIDAGGTGLNIQAANVVILCEPQFKPSTENQAISRVYRMGQTKNVIVYRLLTDDSIDETMLELLGRKTKIFDIYAKNSAVAEAFDTQAEIDIPEDKLQRNIFEIERRRLENSLDKGDESTKEAL